MTDPLGQSQVLPYICGLHKKGYSFTLISCEKKERNTSENRALIQKICDINNIDWRPLRYTKKPPVFSTLKDIQNIKKAAFKAHQEKHFTIVHCRSYIPALIGLQLKQKFDIKFLFDMRGFWADERVEGNIWNLKNPFFKYIYNYFKRKETQFMQESDYVISLTENGKNEIHSWQHLKNNPIPIEVIPCCADLQVFNFHALQQLNVQQKKIELGIPENAKVISYLGSLGTWYLIEEMLDFFKCYQKKHPEAVFLFISPNPKKHIHRISAAKNIDIQKVFVKSAQRDEVPVLASISSLSLLFIKPTYSKKASSPTKQAELMGLGIPIVCNSGVGDTSEIVKKYMSGVVIDAFNENAYKKAIDEIEQLRFEAESIRFGALDYFDLEIAVHRYSILYKRLFSK